MQLIDGFATRTHRLYLISDIHEGTILQHKHGFQQMIDMVLADKNAHVAILGDLAEGITIDDKRYDMATVDKQSPVPMLQYQNLIEMFRPLKGRIRAVLEGNHDMKVTQKWGSGVKALCQELDAPYGTYSCKLAMHDKKGNLMYKAFLTHGNGSINSTADDPVRRESNMQLSLKRKLKPLAGDCIISAMGHTHKLIVKPPISELYLTDEGGKIHQRYTSVQQLAPFIHPDLRWYVNTGSFYKLYHMGESGYAERAMYPPNELGFAIVNVEDGVVTGVDKEILS